MPETLGLHQSEDVHVALHGVKKVMIKALCLNSLVD